MRMPRGISISRTSPENNLDHFCLELEAIGQDELRAWLDSHGVDSGDFQTRYGAGGFGPSLYIHDPDGNGTRSWVWGIRSEFEF